MMTMTIRMEMQCNDGAADGGDDDGGDGDGGDDDDGAVDGGDDYLRPFCPGYRRKWGSSGLQQW